MKFGGCRLTGEGWRVGGNHIVIRLFRRRRRSSSIGGRSGGRGDGHFSLSEVIDGVLKLAHPHVLILLVFGHHDEYSGRAEHVDGEVRRRRILTVPHFDGLLEFDGSCGGLTTVREKIKIGPFRGAGRQEECRQGWVQRGVQLVVDQGGSGSRRSSAGALQHTSLPSSIHPSLLPSIHPSIHPYLASIIYHPGSD